MLNLFRFARSVQSLKQWSAERRATSQLNSSACFFSFTIRLAGKRLAGKTSPAHLRRTSLEAKTHGGGCSNRSPRIARNRRGERTRRSERHQVIWPLTGPYAYNFTPATGGTGRSTRFQPLRSIQTCQGSRRPLDSFTYCPQAGVCSS